VHHQPVIRNAVLHLNNEQPMLVDLFELPERGDVGLRCTNLRSMNGKRPVFVDEIASVFFFPYLHIRFIEIPPRALRDANLSLADAGGEDAAPPELVPVGAPAAEPVEEADLEIDEDFLRRIREV
jgi:hypothetical protein